MNDKQMIFKKTWEDFRKTGLVWWVNRILHLFGWALCFVIEQDNTITDVYPARVKFRGFSRDIEEEEFIKLTKYMCKNDNKLLEEIKE